jgi:hypothetical protein
MIVVGGVPCSGKSSAIHRLSREIKDAVIVDLYDTAAHALVRNLRDAQLSAGDCRTAALRRFREYAALVPPFRRELERRSRGSRCLLVEAVSPVDAFLSDFATLALRLQPPVRIIEERLMARHETSRSDAVRRQVIATACCNRMQLPRNVRIVIDFESELPEIVATIKDLCCV